MAAAMFTHPVDTIKVRLQLNGELSGARGDVISTMIQKEGFTSLWKGLSASLLREGSYSTIRMGLYEPLKHALASPNETEPLWKKIVAGGLAGMIGSGIANPTDLIKVRFQANSNAASIGVISTAKQIIQKEGFVGLYRGVGPTTQRAAILTATQLPVYDHSKRLLIDYGFQEGYTLHFVASMISGFFCATTTSPVDVIKSRYMNQQFVNGKGVLYSSTRDCFVTTLKAEGIRGLYKGWLPNWLRIGPHTVVTFLILEQLRILAGIKPV